MKKALILVLSICVMAFMANFAMAQSDTEVVTGESWQLNAEGVATGTGQASVETEAAYNVGWDYSFGPAGLTFPNQGFHPFGTGIIGTLPGDTPCVPAEAVNGMSNSFNRAIENSAVAEGDNVDLYTREKGWVDGEYVYTTYRGASGFMADFGFVSASQGYNNSDSGASGVAQHQGYASYDARAIGHERGEVSGNADSRGLQAVSTFVNETSEMSRSAMFAGSTNSKSANAYASLDGSGYMTTEAEVADSGYVAGSTYANFNGNEAWTRGEAAYSFEAAASNFAYGPGDISSSASGNGGAFTYGESTVTDTTAASQQTSYSTTNGPVSATAGHNIQNFNMPDFD